MKVWSWVLVFVAACAVEAPQTAEVTQAAGTSAQGTSAQGTSAQGTSAQGTSAQGTSAQGATSGGAAVSSASVVGTALRYWVSAGNYKYLFTPTSRCTYMFGALRGCTTYDLTQQLSPLAGSTWPTTFVRTNADGSKTSLQLKLKIRAAFGSVRNDTSVAMFDLRGSDATGGMVGCDNPPGTCRRNTDLFLYQVDVIDSNGTAAPLCPTGEWAMALAGWWDETSTFHDDANKFSFVCTNGTIAKCARWGYRPWTQALRPNETDPRNALALAPYHQACVRAAMADYCGIGKSYTKNGTVVDVYDFTDPVKKGYGFIQRRHGIHTPVEDDQSMVEEAAFDADGAYTIEALRYAELKPDMRQTCATSYRPFWEQYHWVREGQSSGPFVSIDSTPSCTHSHLMTGKWLHPSCSECVSRIASVRPSCSDPSGAWTAECVALTKQAPYAASCNTPNYPPHDECTTGAGLNVYASGCTLLLSLKGYAGCFNGVSTTAWSSTCVSAANQYCTGGHEHSTLLTRYGFCNQPVFGTAATF